MKLVFIDVRKAHFDGVVPDGVFFYVVEVALRDAASGVSVGKGQRRQGDVRRVLSREGGVNGIFSTGVRAVGRGDDFCEVGTAWCAKRTQST